MERLPFQATQAAAAYQQIRRLPVAVLLDNLRSLYHTGAFFRTADAAGVEKLYLCGITGHPPKKALSKTALGAEERGPGSTPGTPCLSSKPCAPATARSRPSRPPGMRSTCSIGSRASPVCLVFGHEVDRIRPEVARLCGTHVRIPILGISWASSIRSTWLPPAALSSTSCCGNIARCIRGGAARCVQELT
jgi:hypothetical protein